MQAKATMQISLSLQPLHKTTQAAIDRLSRRDRKEIAELLWLSMAFVVLAFGLAIATGVITADSKRFTG